MRHHRPLVTVLLSALFGALLGFVAWTLMHFVAVSEFLQYRMAQEEVALAADTGPSSRPLVLLLATGCLAGAFLGWRLARRRHKESTAA